MRASRRLLGGVTARTRSRLGAACRDVPRCPPASRPMLPSRPASCAAKGRCTVRRQAGQEQSTLTCCPLRYRSNKAAAYGRTGSPFSVQPPADRATWPSLACPFPMPAVGLTGGTSEDGAAGGWLVAARNGDIEKRLWAAADQLRANSSLMPSEYPGRCSGCCSSATPRSGSPRPRSAIGRSEYSQARRSAGGGNACGLSARGRDLPAAGARFGSRRSCRRAPARRAAETRRWA